MWNCSRRTGHLDQDWRHSARFNGDWHGASPSCEFSVFTESLLSSTALFLIVTPYIYVFATRQCQQRHYVFGLSVCHICPFVLSFIWIDLVTVMSHEQLEQS